MSLQHVICLVPLVKLNAWKAEEEKMAFEVMKNENTFVRYLYADHPFRA